MDYQLLTVQFLTKNTTPEFRRALVEQSIASGYNPNYIAAVMSLESNFQPNIQNLQGAPALGLIQFWKSFFPGVAARAGKPNTKWEDLRTMSAIDQLPFVMAYYKGSPLKRDGSGTPTDYYLATFMPSVVGKSPSTVVGRKGDSSLLPGTNLSLAKIYDQNFGLDANKDGTITIADIGQKIEGIVNRAKAQPPTIVTDVDPSRIPGALPKEMPPLAPGSPSQPSGGSSSGAPFKSPSDGKAELPVLELGSRGPAVGLWQRIFNATLGVANGRFRSDWLAKCERLGFPPNQAELLDDDDFGTITLAATVHFQLFRHLAPDGVVGPKTWGKAL